MCNYANVFQASVCQGQPPSSSSSSLAHQPAGVSQNPVGICVTLKSWPTLSTDSDISISLLSFFTVLHSIQVGFPASPVAAQLIGRTQTSSSSGVATTISQQAMLLGNRPANCTQAQMYLRTQMVRTLLKSFSCWYFKTAWLLCPVSIFTLCVFSYFLWQHGISIFNQLATCLSMLSASLF